MASQKVFLIEELVKQDEQGKPVHRTVEVPDGKWVCSAGTRFSLTVEWDEDDETTFYESEEDDYTVVGGVKPDRYIMGRSRGGRSDRGGKTSWGTTDSQLVADQPFGVVHVRKTNGEPSSYLSFRAARQIHKGELGRGLDFPRPRFAREANPCLVEGHVSYVTEKPVHKRDIRRGKMGWARLAEAAALAGYSPEEFVRRFYAFADSDGRGLHAIPDASHEDIHGKVPSHGFTREFFERELFREAPTGCLAVRYQERDLPELFDRDPSRVWLRRGFVLAALSLHHLGYQPSAAVKAA